MQIELLSEDVSYSSFWTEKEEKTWEELKYIPEISISQQIKILQQQLSLLIVREMEIKINYVRQKRNPLSLQINQGNGWLWKLRKEKEKKMVLKLQSKILY